jgi:hypothetical protein
MLLRGKYGWRGLSSEVTIEPCATTGCRATRPAADGRSWTRLIRFVRCNVRVARLGATRHDTDWSEPVSSEVIDAERADLALGGPRQGDAVAYTLERRIRAAIPRSATDTSSSTPIITP